MESRTLRLRHPFQPQTPSGYFQRSMRNVESHDLLERFLLHQCAQQVALAATEVENAPRPARFDSRDRRADPLLAQADRFFELHLSRVVIAFELINVRRLLGRQLIQSAARKALLMSEIAV